MSRKSIAWILEFTSNLPNDQEKVKCLQANDNTPIRTVLRYAFDPNIRWLLPDGDPPYNPCEFAHQENVFYNETKRLYLFIEGGNNNLTQIRREALFLDILGAIDPADARLLVAIKDKKLPWPGITPKIVLTAFPNL